MGGSSLADTRWDCSYHIIFIPKFRRKVFFKEIRKEVGRFFERYASNAMSSWSKAA